MTVAKKAIKPKYETLTSWSFSVYTQWVKCAYSVYLEKVKRIRIQEPPNPAFEKGNRVHAAADAAVRGRRSSKAELQPELIPVKTLLDKFRKLKAVTEQEWAFDRQYNVVDWRDWKRAWLRIKTDLCAVTPGKTPHVDIVDWKTGKQHPEHAQQRSLYALGGLRLVQLGALADGAKQVDLTAQHVYVESGITATEDYTMKNLPALTREWESRVKNMMSDTEYRITPGWHCRFCKFRKSAGGPCPEDK